jgi:hypothetical protein
MMIQILATLDSVATLAALAIGYVLGRRRGPKPPEPLRPICSCEHGYGTHDGGKQCGAQVLTEYNAMRDERLLPCPCRCYDGPDPAIFGLPTP